MLPRPRIRPQRLERVGADRFDARPLVLVREPIDEMPRQRGKVFEPLAQRRELDADDGEPLVEIGAEPAGGYQRLEIAIGCRENPEVHCSPLVSPRRLTTRSSSTRSSFTCSSSGVSSISSRKTLPPAAAISWPS
jgi:hypothetical protein